MPKAHGNIGKDLPGYNLLFTKRSRLRMSFGSGPIRADGTRGYDHPAPLPPPPSKEHPAANIIPQ